MNSRKKSRQALAHLAGEAEITAGDFHIPFYTLYQKCTRKAREKVIQLGLSARSIR